MNLGAPILLVEDDENDILLTEIAFRATGLSNPLLVVPNGAEAIRYLSGDGVYGDKTRYPLPGLVLLDLNMPLLTGFDVLEWLQCHPVTPQVIVVVLTASFNPTDIDRARALGAADYRIKPSNFSHLIPMLRELQARWLGPSQVSDMAAAPPAQNPPTVGPACSAAAGL